MNLILSFLHVNKPRKTVGPFHAVRLDANALRDAASGELVAEHRDHQWELQGVRYHRMDASSHVRIHFEGSRREPAAASGALGPFRRFSAVDGIAYTDDRVFAYVDAVGNWCCYHDGRRWLVMVVSDAAAGRAKSLLALALATLLPGVLALWHGWKRHREEMPCLLAGGFTA